MESLRQLSDQQLTVLIGAGDRAAFTEVYDRYWAILYVHALKMVRDEDEAKDILQELFVTLWSKAADIQLTVSLKSYLYKAVRNKILDLIEKQRVRRNYVAGMIRVAEEGNYITEEQVRLNELKRLIELEVSRLPDRMRKVFMLSRNQNLSYKEISEILEISEGTVKQQVHKAMKILRTRLDLPVALLLFYFYG